MLVFPASVVKLFCFLRPPASAYIPAMTGIKLKDQPVSERPRERLRALGPAAVSPAELIAILLRTGLKGANALELGKQILGQYGSLQALARASVKELQTIKGVGPDKAVTLLAAFTLARKMADEFRNESPLLDTPEAIARVLREQNRRAEVETFQVVLLNIRRRLIEVKEISQGTLDTLLVHPREVFKHALAANAAAHTFGSRHQGNPRPHSCRPVAQNRRARPRHPGSRHNGAVKGLCVAEGIGIFCRVLNYAETCPIVYWTSRKCGYSGASSSA